MKVFISWSGSPSKEIAAVLRHWLPEVIQAVDPYYSPSDIDKGTRWLGEISAELEHSEFGILVLHPL